MLAYIQWTSPIEEDTEKKFFKVLNRFIPAKIKSQQETLNNPITTEPLTKINEPYLNQEIEAHVNQLEITTSSPLCLPDTVNSNISAHVNQLEITTLSPLYLPDTVNSNISAQGNNDVIEGLNKENNSAVNIDPLIVSFNINELQNN
ncbi:37778_t:CDS:2 [Gigaspora margarita]|uniref:37778_t:CDS:1 n=1 Tax=Gigaspora margarita TaxID=4874 RepID=A0ABN7US05_GIGMA|nr:37778_t:CDS:2 [Gigaspora margarita]